MNDVAVKDLGLDIQKKVDKLTKFNKRHGGPYDRGGADSYYRRGNNPHYFVGDTHKGTKIDEENMTYDEVRDSNLEKEYHLKYNHKNPIIFNGKIVHSVDNVIEQERVVLRIKITHESYHDMITRHKANKFVINHKEVIAL